MKNVKCPTLLVIGAADARVPPEQSYYYYNTLKSLGVNTKMYNYPDSGHSLTPCEHFNDANINITLWMNEHLVEPFEPFVPFEAAQEDKKE